MEPSETIRRTDKRVCEYKNCSRLGTPRKRPDGSVARRRFCPKHHRTKNGSLPPEYYDKAVRLSRKHKLSWDDLLKMIEEQDGICPICEHDIVSQDFKFLTVDHDHNTGVVRGLLCERCNHQIGGLERLFEKHVLLKAMNYLSATNPQMEHFVRRYSPDYKP